MMRVVEIVALCLKTRFAYSTLSRIALTQQCAPQCAQSSEPLAGGMIVRDG